MSYGIYIKDGTKAVIALETTGEWRAYIASQFHSGVSSKSSGRFDEEVELVRAGFWIYRAEAGKFEEDYEYDWVFDSLKEAIQRVKAYNKSKAQGAWCCRGTLNMSVNILNNDNNKPMANINVLEKYEQDAFFTKENLAKASAINSNVKSATSALRRVVELLYVTADKVEYIGETINSSANSYDVEGTKKALDRAQKVLDALKDNKVFSFALDTGKTKLEADLEAFDVEEFLGE